MGVGDVARSQALQLTDRFLLSPPIPHPWPSIVFVGSQKWRLRPFSHSRGAVPGYSRGASRRSSSSRPFCRSESLAPNRPGKWGSVNSRLDSKLFRYSNAGGRRGDGGSRIAAGWSNGREETLKRGVSHWIGRQRACANPKSQRPLSGIANGSEGHERPFGGRLFERIQHPHVETGEVPHVARNNGQIMHECRCRDHGVFIDGAGLAVHELGPSAKACGVHREYVV